MLRQRLLTVSQQDLALMQLYVFTCAVGVVCLAVWSFKKLLSKIASWKINFWMDYGFELSIFTKTLPYCNMMGVLYLTISLLLLCPVHLYIVAVTYVLVYRNLLQMKLAAFCGICSVMQHLIPQKWLHFQSVVAFHFYLFVVCTSSTMLISVCISLLLLVFACS